MKSKKKQVEIQDFICDELIELKKLLSVKPEPTAVVIGNLVLTIQEKQPEMTDKAIAEYVGTYPEKIRYSRIVKGFPIKIQDYVSARRVTITVIERLVPLHTRIPEEVLIQLVDRIVADKLNTDEARALTEVVSSVFKDIKRNTGVYTEEQQADMFTTAILSPVKEKGVAPSEIAMTISKYVKGEETKPSLLLSPAQVKFAEALHKEQPLYLRNRQKEFNAFLGSKGQATIMRTDSGICVDIICADEDIPTIVRRMYESTPKKTEKYSDATVDIITQTVKATSVLGDLITDECFIRIAEALRTEKYTTRSSKVVGKDETRHIVVEDTDFIVVTRTDLDASLEMHCRVKFKEVVYTEQGCLITSKYLGGRSIHD